MRDGQIGSARGRMRLFALCGAVACAACAGFPQWRDPGEYEAAVGMISVSAPLFTPIEELPGGDDALRFGDLRDESRLAEDAQAPSMAISQLLYEAVRGSLQVRNAGSQLNVSTLLTSTATNSSTREVTSDVVTRARQTVIEDELTQRRERTFRSPELPSGAPEHLETPDEVRAKLVALLEDSGRMFKLSPGELATLVAAYKTYMVNLEDFYNVEGYGFEGGLTLQGYVPYKAHLTVSVEPGWYTRYHAHDAVVRITLGRAGRSLQQQRQEQRRAQRGISAHEKRFIVVGAAPLETAQAIDQFSAALRKLQLAFEGEGTYEAVAVRAQLAYLREAAERLEGLRTNKTMVVGFEGHNTLRVRLLPSARPTASPVDLQATARLITAIVLVKDSQADDGGGSLVPTAPLNTPVELGAASRLSKSLADLRHLLEDARTKGLDLKALTKLPQLPDGVPLEFAGGEVLSPAELAKLSTEQREDFADTTQLMASQLIEGSAQIQHEAVRERAVKVSNALYMSAGGFRRRRPTPRPIEFPYATDAFFLPAVRDELGDFSPPRRILPGLWTDPIDRRLVFEDGGEDMGHAYVPPWLGPEVKTPLRVTKAFGYYWVELSSVTGARDHAALAERALKQAQEAREKTRGARLKREEAAAVAQAELASLPGTASVESKTAAKIKLAAEKSHLVNAEADERAATKAHEAATRIRDGKIAALHSAASTALRQGDAVVGVEISAPTYVADSSNQLLPAVPWVRLVQAQGSPTPWSRLSPGPTTGCALESSALDLRDALAAWAGIEAPPEREVHVRAFVEVALVDETINAAAGVNDRTIRARSLLEVVLEPRSRTSALPGN